MTKYFHFSGFPILLFSAFLNAEGMDFAKGMESIREEKIEENNENYPVSLKILRISSKSIENWAELWKSDNVFIPIISLDLTIDSNLELFNSWISAFHCYGYSKSPTIDKYLKILLEAQRKFLDSSIGNTLEDEYTRSFLEIIINSCKDS